MGSIGWLVRLGPPALVLAATALGASQLPSRLVADSAAASAARSCPPPADLSALRSLRSRNATIKATIDVAPLLANRGEKVGQLLTVSAQGLPSRNVTLAGESFVARSISNVVVYGDHVPGIGSDVRALDLASGCEFTIPMPPGIVRSAVLDADLGALYIHSVTEQSRADGGVARIDLGSGAIAEVVEPLASDQAFGPVFATTLHWSADGSELAVSSCGFARCHTRVVDVRSGALASFADPPHGDLVGLTASELYVFDVCHGWPCPLLAVERVSGAARVLEPEAYGATLVIESGAAVLHVETQAGVQEIKP
ncbi:MAG: hypothetical protein M3N29_00885 [Chloroflexota bacterium]|nr:hypothetical protein [Chloroflexota bacterium]